MLDVLSDGLRVLNALRHQRSCHSQGGGAWGCYRSVLNALRHQRSCHVPLAGFILDCIFGCSTPCGINEVVTRGLVKARMKPSRAQRLAASTKLSREKSSNPLAPQPGAQRLAASTKLSRGGRVRLLIFLDVCSTPCGINEVVTREGEWRSQPEIVLNALRHQRSCHWRGAQTTSRLARAQRLAASTKLSPDSIVPRNPSVIWCSTPCGINEVVTRFLGRRPASRGVLNALRHQRSCHVRGRRIRLSCQSCAQRLAASTKLSPRLLACSRRR